MAGPHSSVTCSSAPVKLPAATSPIRCKDVDGLSRLGFPIAEVTEEGPAVITKVPGSGGRVTPATCKEQLLYEIHDPSAYITPDTIADFSQVRISETSSIVAVAGATGRPRPDTLKVSLGYLDGFIGEGQISPRFRALERARLALMVVKDRLSSAGIHDADVRCDLIGVDALHGSTLPHRAASPYEVRHGSRPGRRHSKAPAGLVTRWRRCIPTALPEAEASRSRPGKC